LIINDIFGLLIVLDFSVFEFTKADFSSWLTI